MLPNTGWPPKQLHCHTNLQPRRTGTCKHHHDEVVGADVAVGAVRVAQLGGHGAGGERRVNQRLAQPSNQLLPAEGWAAGVRSHVGLGFGTAQRHGRAAHFHEQKIGALELHQSCSSAS